MKYNKSILAVIAFFAFSTLSVSAQSVADKWSQLKDFHELLSKTFHPAEQGNFGPIKLSSTDLVLKIDALKVDTMPQDLRSPKVDETLIVLKRKGKELDQLVQRKAPDAEIMRAFQNLHDVYHRIEEYLSNPR